MGARLAEHGSTESPFCDARGVTPLGRLDPILDCQVREPFIRASDGAYWLYFQESLPVPLLRAGGGRNGQGGADTK